MAVSIHAMSKNRCWFFHRWFVVMSTGHTTYYECDKCRSRKIEQADGGYQPIDYEFLWKGGGK